jgi:hypothetical protein
VGRILHNILAEVLIYIVTAMGLAVTCLPRGTCCRHYHVFVSTTATVLSSAEAAVVVAAVANALELRVAGEGALLLVVALLGLLFLIQSAAA